MKKLYMFFAAVLMLAGCAANQNMPAEYCGTFKGTLPAASGPGIETTIQLNRDYSFLEQDVYIGEKDGIFNNQGSYMVNGDIITLKPANGEVSYYRVEKDQLRRLDMMKRPITGVLANNYILKKTACCR